MTNPKFPEVQVTLVGEDDNAFAIMGAVKTAMIRAGVDMVHVEAYLSEAMSGDYDHLLLTTMNTVSVA